MKLLSTTLLFILTLLLNSPTVKAQTNDSLYYYIDIPLIEYPYNTNFKYRTVSMQQSIKLSKSFYYVIHTELDILGKNKLGKRGDFWSKVIMSTIDFVPLPFSNIWLHEEWHRSILTLNQVESKNTYWSGSVEQVADNDLVLLKLNSPPDMVREATAGNEGNLEFVHSLQKDVFFNDANAWTYGLYWGNYLVNSFYLFGSTREGSKPLVKFKNSETVDILSRDANGYDPINATYDLFNPYTPYEERGIHPSGVGIDRYVEFNDLSNEEQQFLKNQFSLSFLNFMDLNLIGIDYLGKKELKYNFSIRHHMTSFGYMVGGNIFLKNNTFGGVLKPIFYKNNERAFLGIDVEVRNNWGMIRLAGWQQPENQLFFDTDAAIGGLVSAAISPTLKNNISPYFEFTLKSKGWVAGNPYLNRNFTCVLGLSMSFNRTIIR